MINIPNPPLFTGDSQVDIELLKTYIYDLHSSLISNTATGYAVNGLALVRILTVGDSLGQTQDVLGTLIKDLIAKGVITV